MAGVRSKPKAGKYQGWYTDYTGRRVWFTGTQRKKETMAIARGLDDQHRQVRLGYRDLPSLASRRAEVDLGEVASEYIEWGETQGGWGGYPWSENHRRKRLSQLRWWKQTLDLRVMADLAGILPKAERALRKLAQTGRNGKGRPLAGKTVNSYIDTLKSFCTWCIERDYLDHNPVAKLKFFDDSPKSVRRALTPVEVRQLLKVAPDHRRLLYEVAFCTGLRAGEIRSLTLRHLDMDRCGFELDPRWTKNRKSGFQPLPRILAERLYEYGESGEASLLYEDRYARGDAHLDAVPDDPLLFVPTHPARAIHEDLTRAGIPIETDEGKLDFHSCRVGYVTFVLEAGASAKEGQALARHSTVEMTMNIYAKTRSDRLAEIAEKVGESILGD